MSNGQTQIERAIGQIKTAYKGVVPEIDFSQHTLEDGSTVNTQERVIKDVRVQRV